MSRCVTSNSLLIFLNKVGLVKISLISMLESHLKVGWLLACNFVDNSNQGALNIKNTNTCYNAHAYYFKIIEKNICNLYTIGSWRYVTVVQLSH